MPKLAYGIFTNPLACARGSVAASEPRPQGSGTPELLFASRLIFIALALAFTVAAHPMGNFSVSHYAKFVITERGVKVEYALDLAEIPTFELLRTWGVERSSPQPELQAKADEQARQWVRDLAIRVDGQTARLALDSTSIVIADGAGNLPIVRVTVQGHIDKRGGRLDYEDRNYPDRAGWKEIVIDTRPGVKLELASQSSVDISRGLTHYPADPTTAPPQDLRARASWKLTPAAPLAPKPEVAAIPQPSRAPSASAPALMTRQAAPPGTVVRGDFLSGVLHQTHLTAWMLLIALGAAFVLGGAHALTPGHGKTIVAAYLVGSRGNLKHAVFLGAMVTFTHTIVVFLLGLATLFLFHYVVPEKITQALGVASGLCIVLLGAWMLRKRILASSASHGHHHHDHHHHDDAHPDSHDHHHHHHHDHAHDHHQHHHGPHDHSHTHSHVPEDLSWGGLVALGASGGLVPCESALILLLGAIALGRVGLGLVLLLSFSLGLATVLMAIGILVLYAKRLLPQSRRSANQAFLRYVSVASATAVLLIGVLMTGTSLGLIRFRWPIG